MKTKNILFILIIIFFSISLVSSLSGISKIPMIISGKAYINKELSPQGTEIVAKVKGETIDETKVDENGRFGFALLDLEEGDKIEFYINGIYTKQSINYKESSFEKIILKIETNYLKYYLAGFAVLLTALILWQRKSFS